MIQINFILPNGEKKTVTANVGDNLLDVAMHNHLPIQADCGGSCACSTCHVIVEAQFDKIEKPKNDEMDMLDFAYNLTDKSRLACQIIITEKMDGLTLRLLEDTRNFG